MTPKQMQELLPVANAYAQGQAVQWRVPHCDGWCDFNLGLAHCQPKFLETGYEWRVKPRCPRELWGVYYLKPAIAHGKVCVFACESEARDHVRMSAEARILVKVVEVVE